MHVYMDVYGCLDICMHTPLYLCAWTYICVCTPVCTCIHARPPPPVCVWPEQSDSGGVGCDLKDKGRCSHQAWWSLQQGTV